MRRLICITAFALFLAVPLWAQHGGGHGGGGHAGGFGGGHAAGFSSHSSSGSGGFHFTPGVHSYSGPLSSASPRGFSRGSTFSQRGFSRGPFLHDGFRGPRIRTYGFRNNCYGYGCWGRYGYPWYGGYYDPWWWWDSDSSYDEDYDRDRATAEGMNQQSLEEQRMLRQEEAEGDQDIYARSAPAPRQPEGQPILPATVLVFRDKHQREIQNYAIVGQTLWNFAPQRTEKISLADLDLPATTKANDDRGLTFRLPGEAR